MKNLNLEDYAKQDEKRKKILGEASNGAIFALVSTIKSLLLVNLNTKEVIPLEVDRGDYYGISWFPGGKDLVLSHSTFFAEFNNYPTLADWPFSEVGTLSHGNIKTPQFLSDPHQIFCASDGQGNRI